MKKKTQLRLVNREAAEELVEIKAIIKALCIMNQGEYPANSLLEIASKKITRAFHAVEKNRKILKIT